MENRFYTDFDTDWIGRGQSKNVKGRTPFEQDRDRIIYSPAFRRLQNKTQVFLSGEFDFYRTRLTHSMEVSQIGRSIVNHLNRTSPQLSDGFHIDQDLVESICLAHDIGHPSFGHAGEQVLNELMFAEGGFEGNAQNLRILVDLFYRDKSQWSGMNPTRAFLDGMLKYKTLFSHSQEKKNHFIYDFQKDILDFVIPQPDFLKGLTTEHELNSFKSLECRIMDWADDIAYSIHDIDDGIRAGFITMKKIRNWLDTHEKEYAENEITFLESLCESIVDDSFSATLARLIGLFIHSTTLITRNTALGEKTNRYKFDILVEGESRRLCEMLKSLAIGLVFHTPQVHQLEYKGGRILRKLFSVMEEEYMKDGTHPFRLLPAHYHEAMATSSHLQKKRMLCDYLSGMTDGFVVRTYKRLFDPDFGSIIDLI
ncbi:dGTP triphosphohydrolase [Pseudodesulfovibrio piezophilus]|uniref:Deoxyguanosinetriphosphate triphosphohydrolase-like protein n=1 Tax=Pseudodesulfovibrio piezophilus (strain DSM 21447 / JCM 15486 / C1TLV30) TaxID=1322246 RepID=M1WUK1_PSEP2|nr:dNTP triphosphohydrolase [Pseudodesulfovibrio piezophilus]CCH47478.1 Deoxyguanosinetriphosphate triphosphohydrolase-like protein [Pseudodesulfovibrio piezophilus C1TLV30]